MSDLDGLKAIDSDVSTILSNFQKSVSRLKGKADDIERVKRCEELMRRFELTIENYQVDLSSLSDPVGRREFSAKMDKHLENFAGLKFKYGEKKRESEKQTFLRTKSEIDKKGKTLTGEEDISGLDRQQAVAMGDVIIGKAQSSLERSKALALQSEQIGTETLQKMNEQSEKMDQIYEGLEEIEGNLARSRQLLGKIAQSAANDRFIQVLCVLIFIAVVVAITLDKTSKKGTATSNTISGGRRLGGW